MKSWKNLLLYLQSLPFSKLPNLYLFNEGLILSGELIFINFNIYNLYTDIYITNIFNNLF